MNFIVNVLILALATCAAVADVSTERAAARPPAVNCETTQVNMTSDWVTMADPCVKAVRGQIQEEMHAAMAYLAMGAHFSRDTVNRPGFAKMFFEHASEERGHSIKLISYLLMRGELTEDVSSLLQVRPDRALQTDFDSGIDALKAALDLEISVTNKIQNLVKLCEDTTPAQAKQLKNDYELVDYLTGDFLREQYEGMRELAGRISTLEKMHREHGVLGEFLYDKQLL